MANQKDAVMACVSAGLFRVSFNLRLKSLVL